MALYAGYWGPEAMLWAGTGQPARRTLATVIRQDDGLPATLYTDRTKAVQAANPIATDAAGNLAFFADPDEYLVTLSGSSQSFVAIVRPDLNEPGSGGAGITDHGLLTGLADDDHPQYQTAAEVDARIAAVIGTAPAALDTLGELSDALADDANFAASVTASMATKAPLNSPGFTGTPTGITKAHVGLGSVDNTPDTGKPLSTPQRTVLNGRLVGAVPLAHAGLISANAPLVSVAKDNSPFGGPKVWYAALLWPAGVPLSGGAAAIKQAAIVGAGGHNGFGFYVYSGGMCTFLDATADDNAVWNTTGPIKKLLAAPHAGPATDTIVYVGARIDGMTQEPYWAFVTGDAALGVFRGWGTAKLSIPGPGGDTTWPASFDPATYGGDPSGYMPFLGLV